MNINFIQNLPVRLEVDLDISIDFYRLLWQELQIVTPIGKKLCRIGNEYDGGYIMIDDFQGKIAYSFGINTDVSWDDEIADRGYDVYMYDHTIDSLPHERNEFHWFKNGLADNIGKDSLLHFLDWYLLKNKHFQEEHMLLKMDVEGAEWGGMEQLNPIILTQFDQIVMEVHDLICAHNEQKRMQILSVLHKLNQTHYLVHIHGNNNDSALTLEGRITPNVMELTWVNKQLVEVDRISAVSFPRELDRPNAPHLPDYIMGKIKYNK